MPVVKSNLDKQVARRLSDDDVRYTRGRRDVVNALNDAEGPQSAAELSGQLGSSIPLSSIYRTLSVLEEAEILTPHFSSPGVTRYELSEWLTGHHHHLVCTKCGRVEDIETGDVIESRIQNIVTDLARASSFIETNHALEIEGRCQKCA
jgi:Fur family transcriptional regulator, ferric uptake regulator